jgi:hypothetical protein
MTEDRCQMTEVIECGIGNGEFGMVRLSPRNPQRVTPPASPERLAMAGRPQPGTETSDP